MNGQPLANQLIGIYPEELHVQKEQRHQESDDEGAQKRAKKEPGSALQSGRIVDNQ